MEVLVGKIINTYGIKGAVKVFSHTDFPELRYKKNAKVFVCDEDGNNKTILTIKTHTRNKNIDIIAFKEFDDINQVLKFINYEIRVDAKSSDLNEDFYFYGDLLDCKIIFKDKVIGKVIEVLDTGIQHNLRILKDDGKVFLYPFLNRFLSKVDIENKIIYINPIEGMI